METLDTIYQRIEHARETSPTGEAVTVVAVIKNQPTQAANALIQEGIGIVAENRVQALRDRGADLLPSQRHIIGHLQTNKVKIAVTLADMIQSVDSMRLLHEIEKQSGQLGKKTEILFQVNIAKEESKFGADKEDLPFLLRAASEMEHVTVRGLMAIMPIETKVLYYR